MFIVLPFSSATPGIGKLVDGFKSKGTNAAHPLHILTTRDDEEAAFAVGDGLSEHFQKVTVQTLPASAPPPGIKLANEMFFAALMRFKSFTPAAEDVQDQPMMYFDPTYRPAARNWADLLQSEFFLRGAPPVLARTNTTGAKATFVRLTVGPVIFGRKFFEKAVLIDHLGGTEHWRVRMCHELAQVTVETRQIGSGSQSLLKQIRMD